MKRQDPKYPRIATLYLASIFVAYSLLEAVRHNVIALSD